MANRVSAEDLKNTDIFAGLSGEGLQQIAGLCAVTNHIDGEVCALQGAKMNHLLIVNRGKIAVEMGVSAASHTYTVVITTLTKGRVCAWSALVPPNELTASLKCVGEAQLISIPACDLQKLFAETPALGYAAMKNMAAVISSRLTESRTKLERLVAELLKQGR